MSWCSPRAWDREPTPSLWPRPPQVHAGKDVLNSELVLPSGMGLSLGAMIHVMRRRKVMDGIFEVGEAGKGREGKGREGGCNDPHDDLRTAEGYDGIFEVRGGRGGGRRRGREGGGE